MSQLAWQHRYVAEVVRDPRLVSDQRASVARCLSRWGVAGGGAADVVLAVSELLSNAMLYSSSDAIGLSVSCSRGEVRIEVDDRTPGAWPARTCPADDDEHGRGLLLVEALSEACGVSEDGTVAWCTLITERTS